MVKMVQTTKKQEIINEEEILKLSNLEWIYEFVEQRQTAERWRNIPLKVLKSKNG